MKGCVSLKGTMVVGFSALMAKKKEKKPKIRWTIMKVKMCIGCLPFKIVVVKESVMSCG